MRPFGSSLTSGSIGTPKLSEFAREQSHDGSKTVRASPKGVDLVSLICIFSSLPSTRPFRSLLASGSIGTPKLSEFAQ
ncbi:hypothetical protein DVH24_034314 [Malus domestica]|uniref:Uncharacterized protein n=1 Tax=Malus domestica TaxID=3750 RepID=A0A498IZ79_MALDO|nr:hypothetical protein DVH24_034314 [Malus domestica]